ncbi:hypothetical protein SK128_010269 [Halocaridina rubra]|uniref:Uncharacterized protein n=1 Tax=Halocaridina rubra TaxID=373956 RepID=A0AAN8ZZ19_HALRR
MEDRTAHNLIHHQHNMHSLRGLWESPALSVVFLGGFSARHLREQQQQGLTGSRGLLGLAGLHPCPKGPDCMEVCIADDVFAVPVNSNEADPSETVGDGKIIEDNGNVVIGEDSMQDTEIAMEAEGIEESLSNIMNSNRVLLHNLEETAEPTKIINVTNEESFNIEGSVTDSAAPPNEDFNERRSSNSSLTSVTSRGSIMSPPEFNGASGATSPANFSSKMSSLKGRLSGAFTYWTGREKSPTQEKPCKLNQFFHECDTVTGREN